MREKVAEGVVSEGVVIETVEGITVFVLGDTACSLWVRIAAGNNSSIIGSIVRIVIRTVGRIIIIKIIIKPTSTELENKYG